MHVTRSTLERLLGRAEVLKDEAEVTRLKLALANYRPDPDRVHRGKLAGQTRARNRAKGRK